jgi:hypothetical protein
VLGSQFSATLCELNCPPLPASVIDSPPAVLVIAIDPATLPVADGENVTFSAAVCPGANIVFVPAPLALNPVPVTTTLEIVTFALPAFVSVTPWELLVPSTTLPKSRLVALEVSSGVAVVALPLAEITRGELGALLVSEIDPVTFPAEVGENTTLKAVFCPGAMLIGTVRPEVPKPAPVTLALEIVTVAVPAFCRVIVCDPLDPVVMPGKLALSGVAESCGCGVVVGGGGGGGVVGGGVVGGGVVLGADVPLPLPVEFDPMTTPAHPLPTIDAASNSASKHFDVLPAPGH